MVIHWLSFDNDRKPPISHVQVVEIDFVKWILRASNELQRVASIDFESQFMSVILPQRRMMSCWEDKLFKNRNCIILQWPRNCLTDGNEGLAGGLEGSEESLFGLFVQAACRFVQQRLTDTNNTVKKHQGIEWDFPKDSPGKEIGGAVWPRRSSAARPGSSTSTSPSLPPPIGRPPIPSQLQSRQLCKRPSQLARDDRPI